MFICCVARVASIPAAIFEYSMDETLSYADESASYKIKVVLQNLLDEQNRLSNFLERIFPKSLPMGLDYTWSFFVV